MCATVNGFTAEAEAKMKAYTSEAARFCILPAVGNVSNGSSQSRQTEQGGEKEV